MRFDVTYAPAAPDDTDCDVASSLVRARYRDGLDQTKLLTPGEVVEYHIKLRPTSNEFRPRHRIRLDIRLERNA